MTQSDALRLVALIDRLWFGANLTEAMKADRVMFDEWFEILEPIDAEAARRAVQHLNGESDFPPRPGRIVRRAEEMAAALPAPTDPELLREPTEEERRVAARLPELRARIRQIAGQHRFRVVE